MTTTKPIIYLTALFLLIAATEAAAQVVSITTDAGDTYEVPVGSSVYIAKAPAFSMETEASGDLLFKRLTSIDGVTDEGPVVFTEPVEECKIDGPIVRVDGEWRFCNGTGWVVGGTEQQWAESQYSDTSASFRSAIANYTPYLGDTPQRLKEMLVGNGWWYSRLPRYAAEVVDTGGSERFFREFRGVNAELQRYALELLNRYVALLVDGYTEQEINDYVWGGE